VDLCTDVSLSAKAAEDSVAHPENENLNGFSKQSIKKVMCRCDGPPPIPTFRLIVETFSNYLIGSWSKLLTHGSLEAG